METTQTQVTGEPLEKVAVGVLDQRLRALVGREAALLVVLLDHLGVLDERRGFVELGYNSLFAYCEKALGFSGDAAYRRIRVARLVRRFPSLRAVIAKRRLHLAGLAILAPYLTDDNLTELIATAAGMSKRKLEALAESLRAAASRARSPEPAPLPLLDPSKGRPGRPENRRSARSDSPRPGARLLPLLDRPEPTGGPSGRRVPGTSDSPRSEPPPRPAPPAAQGRAAHHRERPITLSVRATPGLAAKLERARALLSHATTDEAEVLERALDLLIEREEKRRFGSPRRRKRASPSPSLSLSPASATTRPGASSAPLGAELAPAPTPAPSVSSDPDRRSAAPAVAPAASDRPLASPNRPVELAPTEIAPPGDAFHDEAAPTRPGASRPQRSPIPTWIRHTVYTRDAGSCSWTSPTGHRCGSRHRLELHHIVPWARGGPDTVENLTLHCREHNRYEALREGLIAPG